jgi:hypothetical protein
LRRLSERQNNLNRSACANPRAANGGVREVGIRVLSAVAAARHPALMPIAARVADAPTTGLRRAEAPDCPRSGQLRRARGARSRGARHRHR